MQTIDQLGAQGDVLFRKVKNLPEGLNKSDSPAPIVAHSETGHHHICRAKPGYEVEHFVKDEMTSFLRIRQKRQEITDQANAASAAITEALASNTIGAEVEHHRPYDTHETLGLGCEGEETIYEVLRQEEYTPEGWRQIQD